MQAFSRPLRDLELEARVNKELRELDSLLFLFWMDTAYWNDRHKGFEGRYALAVTWPQSDRRWTMYQNGEIGEPFDILGWFAEDMHNAASVPQSPDLIWNKALELLASADNEREPWKHKMKRVAEANIARKKQIRSDFLENEVHDIASHYRAEGLGIHQVNVPVQLKDNT